MERLTHRRTHASHNKEPMDLGTIRENLRNNQYKTIEDVYQHVKLVRESRLGHETKQEWIEGDADRVHDATCVSSTRATFCSSCVQVFRNCRAFNPPGDPVRIAGDKLEQHFDKLWKGAKLPLASPMDPAEGTQGKSKKRKADTQAEPTKEKKTPQNKAEMQTDQSQAKKLKIKIKAPADASDKETAAEEKSVPGPEANDPAPTAVEERMEPTPAEKHQKRMEQALAIVRKLIGLPEAELFSEPVDAEALGIPEYLEVIKEPMDLGTILGRLEVGESQGWENCIYKGVDEVKRDIELVWSNCYTFNMPGEPISDLCKDMENAFKKEWKKLEAGPGAKTKLAAEREKGSGAAEPGPGSASMKHIRVPGGRCPICLVQKKGRCGTETAPMRCLRRKENGLPYQEVSDEHLERLLAMQRENKASGDPKRGKGTSRSKMEREEKRRNRAYSIINTAENALQNVKDARQLLEEVEANEEKKRLEELEEIKEEEKLIASIPTVPDDYRPPRREIPAAIYKMSSYWFGSYLKGTDEPPERKPHAPRRPFEDALKSIFENSNL